jgi:hypothetical protein
MSATSPVFLDPGALMASEHASMIEEFRFNNTVPPFGRFQDAAAVCLFYFLLLRGLKATMAHRKPLELRLFVTIHRSC